MRKLAEVLNVGEAVVYSPCAEFRINVVPPNYMQKIVGHDPITVTAYFMFGNVLSKSRKIKLCKAVFYLMSEIMQSNAEMPENEEDLLDYMRYVTRHKEVRIYRKSENTYTYITESSVGAGIPLSYSYVHKI